MAFEGPTRPAGEVLALLSLALRPPVGRESFDAALEQLQGVVGDATVRPWILAAREASRNLDLVREYHRLFLGPSKPLAPPFESVYRDGGVFGPSTAAVVREMRELGLETAAEFHLPPDHVCIELEFLAWLEARREDATRTGRMEEAAEWGRRYRMFLDGHVAGWLPRLLARLEASAPDSPFTSLVRAAAHLLALRPPAG